MIVSLLYKLTRKLLTIPSAVLRSETAKDAEILVWVPKVSHVA
ncbi:hypothetical protein [Saccharothrix yanglingensis]|nr:hypothetical protein [Saccharothrix yanglingensis]